MADVEKAQPMQGAAPVKPAKPPRPPSLTLPRLFAAAAIVTLLAIPIVVPVVVMKVTGKSGKPPPLTLADAIVAPVAVKVTPAEEDTREQLQESFLKINNNTFERFCRPYFTAGFNAYELVEAAMVSARAETTGDRSGAQVVDDTLRDAAARGINTIRMWGHTTSSLYPFQVGPGKYDERGLKALDFVLETARKYGLQVIISLIDNWKYYNGVDQYVDWSSTAPARGPDNAPPFQDKTGDPNPGDYGAGPDAQQVKQYEVARHALFYTDPDARRLYKGHVAFMLGRNNSINGRKYSEDPTIIAWNLINEPRCESWLDANKDCPARLQAWLEEMAAHVRANDPNHLITIGSEGFYGYSTPKLLSKNPADWASDMGQDFVMNTNIPEIDFATVHAWPDNWLIPQQQTPAFLDAWVQSHIAMATAGLNTSKPVLFEEFGKKLSEEEQSPEQIALLRDPIYKSTYESVQRAIDEGQPIAGSLFWKWAIPLFDTQDLRGPYGVLPGDSTMDFIQQHADYMKRKLNSVPPRPSCKLGAWFGVVDAATGVRDCVNIPDVSAVYWNAKPVNASSTNSVALQKVADLKAGRSLVFPLKSYCCKPGTGAFQQGCSNADAPSA